MSQRALFVGVNQYGRAGLARLTTPARDADALYRLFFDQRWFSALRVIPAGPGRPPYEKTCIDGDVSAGGLADEVKWLLGASGQEQKPDLLLFYFSGHGEVRENPVSPGHRRVYLCASNQREALALDELLIGFADSGASKVVILLDCCFSGQVVDLASQFEGRKGLFLASSRADEQSFEHGEYSTFTGHLIRSLRSLIERRGEVDANALVSELRGRMAGQGQEFQFGILNQGIVLFPGGVPLRPELDLPPDYRVYLERLVASWRERTATWLDPASRAVGAQVRVAEVYIDPPLLDTAQETAARPAAPLPSGMERLDDRAKPFTVVLGILGAGKSILAEERAAHFAAALLQGLDPEANSARWPMRILLREVIDEIPERAVDAGAELIWRFVALELGRRLPNCDAQELARALTEPLGQRGLFLLDGLDEIPGDGVRRRLLCRALAAFVNTLGPNARVVLTGRPHAFDAEQQLLLHRFRTLRLGDLDPERIVGFIDRVYNLAQAPLGWDDQTRRRYCDDLKVALRERTYLAELATRPLLLTLLATLHLTQTRLPRDRADLYEGVISLLLSRWQRQLDATETRLVPEVLQGYLRSDIQGLRDRIQALAYRLHVRHRSSRGRAADATGAGITEVEVLGLFAQEFPRTIHPADLLEFLDRRAGLLLRGANGLYDFPHRSCREYLAACYLVDNEDDPGAKLRSLLDEDRSWWREVYLLAVAKTSHGSMVGALDLVEGLLPEPAAQGALYDGPWRGVSLAGCALVELRSTERASAQRSTRRVLGLVVAWLRRLVEEGRLPAAERAEAAEYLGQLGDPRPGVGLEADTGLPDIAWVLLPAGEQPIGEGGDRRSVPIAAFAIAKYPVTVAQYRAYLEADHGPADSPTEPSRWTKQLRHPTRPVVGLSWPEANGFCRWLSRRRGWKVRLPMEQEWEYAAHISPEHPYPWGSDATAAAGRANLRDSGIGAPSPVGVFQTGASPDGVMDLIGNVWEWCCQRFRSDLSRMHRPRCDAADLDGDRSVRGGSWWNPLPQSIAMCRQSCGAHTRDANVGFRVVCHGDMAGVSAWHERQGIARGARTSDAADARLPVLCPGPGDVED